MATIITIRKNTFNKNQHKKFQLLSDLVNGFIYRTYPSGTGGYEDFYPVNNFLHVLTVSKTYGDPRTEGRLVLDPARMSERHIQALKVTNELASKYGFAPWTLLGTVFAGEPLPTEKEFLYCVKLSQAHNKRTDLSWLHTLRSNEQKHKKGMPIDLIGTNKYREVMEEFIATL